MLKHAKDIFSVTIGLAGLALLSYGAYLFTPALGFGVLGAAFMAWSFLIARTAKG
jgi:hypothetical protein